MKKNDVRVILVCMLLIITLGGCKASDSPGNTTISLSGSDWFIHEDPTGEGVANKMYVEATDSAGWIPAQVPGNIQADVEAAHLLPPLWYGAINPELYDVALKDWWYRKDFVVPASFSEQRLMLVFDGVDERCQVWLNGQKIGANAGMFRRFSFDVSEIVQPGQSNHLAVQISRMPEELLPYLINSDGPDDPKSVHWFLNGINKTRQVLKDLKTPGNFSYDWSNNVWTLGIWKNVRLEATGSARIEWTRVSTELTDEFTKATVTATLEIDSNTEESVQASFTIKGHGTDISKVVNATLKKGRNLIKAELPVANPALWWCNGHGEQPLYMLHAKLETADGVVSDTRSTRFGIRDIKWIYTEGAPKDFVSRYQLVLNGRLVRLIGTGIIYPYIMPGLGLEHELQLMQHAKYAGMNFIRINGGGGGALFDSPWFALADELGIMISHEFPLGNCVPEKDDVFLKNLEVTLSSILKQYRNHPSIIEFAGGNEMNWSSNTIHPALQLMQKLAAEETDQIFRATCPDLGAKHYPWDFDIYSTTTDMSYKHYNTVETVLNGEFGQLRSTFPPIVDTMRYGEFGTSSPSHIEVWHRDIPLKSQWPLDDVTDPVMIRKNTLNAVFSPYHWLLKPRIDRAFGSPDNLGDLILAGQYLGAEPLRYTYDELRRRGKRIGGFTNHCYSEPWPNTAGSYMVDFDGRTLMNYDFLKQAMVPISLSLRYDSVLYHPKDGVKAFLFLVSDAPKAATGLKWKWLARDRRGNVFANDEGTAEIEPLEVKSLGLLTLKPSKETEEGPVFVELRLEDSAGKLLVERVTIFGRRDVDGPFAGLINNKLVDKDDSIIAEDDESLLGPNNLALSGNGAKVTASSSLPEPHHKAANLIEGEYGHMHSWIGETPMSWFQISLNKPAMVGRFKLGRDRSGTFKDRQPDYVKIETSLDGEEWSTSFEKKGLTTLTDFNPTKTMQIQIAPVKAKFVKVTVDSLKSADGLMACVDEFEIFAPAKKQLTHLPDVQFVPIWGRTPKPVKQTTLVVQASSPRIEDGQEFMDLQVRNTGSMTALFCEPHPLIAYRTDLSITNSNCFIPPGENRVITIRTMRTSQTPEADLTLAQTGWRISCWNADDVMIAPSADIFLSVGRRDKTCREYLGYFDKKKIANKGEVSLTGRRPATEALPFIVQGPTTPIFNFNISEAQANAPAILRIHTSDQSKNMPADVEVNINGKVFERTLCRGYGLQANNPAHLADPESIHLKLPQGTLKKGENTIKIRVTNGGWFSWDSLDVLAKK